MYVQHAGVIQSLMFMLDYQLREVSRRWSVLQLVSLPNPADVPQGMTHHKLTSYHKKVLE